MTPRRPSVRPTDERVLRAAAGVMVGFLVVGASLVLASVLLGGPNDGPDNGPRDARASGATASASGSTTGSTPAASPSVATSPRMRAPTMTAFLRSYLATAPRDPATTWGELTARFQRVSGGLSAYEQFWSPIETATPFGIFAEPRARRITYRVRYSYPDRRAVVDSTRLELVLTSGGKYRIDGEG